MLKKFYSNYLFKDKPLRHASQHLVVTFFVAIFYSLIAKTFTGSDLLIFLVFTYLPDIDGLSSTFFWRKSNSTAEVVYGYLIKLKFNKALAYGTIHHKKLNRPILHNVVVYPLLWVLFLNLLAQGNPTAIVIVLTLLGHLTFDLLDDAYQLKNINNWLWPIYFINRHLRHRVLRWVLRIAG